MANKFSKRGKNPGAVDSWLDSLGYYRKNVAYDETCLFRAVAEQLFNSQLYHEKVRKECILHGKKNTKQFKISFPAKREWWERLNKLDLHMQICNDVEIQLICNTYNVDISVLNANDHSIMEFRHPPNYKTKQTIRLCKMNEDHYDSVYSKQYINDAGFCQSIVYNLLYEDVFQIQNVSSIVNAMLHEKQAVCTIFNANPEVVAIKEDYFADEEVDSETRLHLTNCSPNCMIAPFPFKVAKALDPNMYRNIEYDTWLEVRRAMRLGDWYYGDDKFILGTRCKVDLNGVTTSCYIQEMLKDNECIVYVPTTAQRMTVNYADLKPEENAKPWPLPYRFVRKAPLQSPNDGIRPENEQGLRKRREKSRVNNLNNVVKSNTTENENDVNTLNYQGCNLETAQSNPTEKNLTLNISTADVLDNWSNVNNLRHSESSALSWTESPVASGTDNALDTLNKSPLESTRNLYYNYDQDVPCPLPVWIPATYVVPPEENVTFNQEDNSSPTSEPDYTAQNYFVYPVDNGYTSHALYTPPLSTPSPALTPYSPVVNDRFVCSNPVSPIIPHMDPIPIIYSLPSHTPSIFYPYPSHPHAPYPSHPHAYSSVTSRPPESLTSPMPVYNNPPDFQYPAYIYSPPTPPVTWYPPNVNAQGFIYPPPLN